MSQIRMLDNLSPPPAAQRVEPVLIAKTGQRTFESLELAEAFIDALLPRGRDPVLSGRAGAWRVFW